jgi:hypothetical protein
MKKTDRILQSLADAEAPLLTSDLAAAIDDADGPSRVNALLNYLAGHGKVERTNADAGRTAEASWRITKDGRDWLAEVVDDAPAEPTGKLVHEAKRQKVAKSRRDKAADPEKLAPLPRRKVQRTAAVSQPAAAVELIPPAPINGRAIAVREDGAVLVLEHDVVVTTLVPEDARRIALVVNRLMGASA